MKLRVVPTFSQAELRAELSYDPETGIFTRLRGQKAGKRAGTLHRAGYVRVCIFGKYYSGHRLAWFWMTGEWPLDEVDHRNLIKGDNRWVNLRSSDRSGNMGNRVAYANNKSGLKGVWFVKRTGRWASQIQKDKVRITLGEFDCPEDAHAAYTAAANDNFGQFARSA